MQVPVSLPTPSRPPTAPPRVRLSDRVRLVRNVLPPLIILVVALVEFMISRLPNTQAELWAHLLFYGLVGPAVTYFSVEWIAEGTRARERAERELRDLYGQLSTSHARLQAVQELMRDLGGAPDMGAVLEVAARGAVRVTGATHATLSLPGGLGGSARGDTLLSAPSAALHPLAVRLPGGGELLLHFETPPSADALALAQALAAEVTTGIEAARQRTLDLMTLYSVDQSIRAERNMRRLLARITRTMAERVGADARAAYLSDQDGVLRLEYAQDRLGEAPGGMPAPAFAAHVAASMLPLITDGPAAGEVFPGVRSVLGLSMRDEDGLVGVLVFGHHDAGAFDDARLPLLALMAGQATLAVRNARAYLYSEELAIGDERARIAREIHDGVAQSLAFAALKLDVVARQLHTDPVQAEAEVKGASALLREQIREVRRSIFALRPIDLERYGLLETARRYVLDFGEQNGVRASLDVSGEIHLSPGDEAVIFRILQESLNNVAKHARAREVSVTLRGGARVTLRVQDDGQGFDPEQVSGRVSSAGGLGLMQMRERIEARGGQYRILSAPGHGTVIEAEMPQG
ncbi:signal transduction histidine kinase [Deinococcus metalli]|uniref:Oxygen sensor histidine kinase NreB n=1 Tax=Deinococcus metalli TaxID=1141878 RepID=A0A7W8KFC0_9DEIO|nr:GAF domain-containing sensor histidine kinase [Deinococcus metalli]MBB5377147.1 signal transduction histidine kinase [Deinococcus metalli]GHF48640.1 sensor histidine kinase [Deinococcus metalli]